MKIYTKIIEQISIVFLNLFY